MTILTSIILVVAIIAIALAVAYNVQKGTKTLQEFKADYDNNEEAQELVELTKQLYNKDLRPAPTKKAPKKEKPVEQVETIAEVVAPQPTPVQVEPVVEKVKESKPEFPIDKPKKKRRHYSKKK